MKNLYFFLDLILSVLSYIVPKNKKMIILGSRYGKDFTGNPKYFFLYLLIKKNNYYKEIFWMTKNKKILVELEEKQLPVLYIYSWKGFKAILRSQHLVISSVYIKRFLKFTLSQVNDPCIEQIELVPLFR